MSSRTARGYGKLQRTLAWGGALLMAACFIWLQLLPKKPWNPEEALEPHGHDGVAMVVIDAGHGGQDSGTMRDGVLEKDLTLDVSRRLDQLLRANGFRTMLTRGADEYVSLANRASAANAQRNCVFVSIHFDEGSRATASGVNTYYAARQVPKSPFLPSWIPFLQPVAAESANVESQSLAGFVQQALIARTQAVDRGTRSEQFYVIANVQHPAVLVEGGFLTNNDDMAKLRNEDYRQQLALAISEGLIHYRQLARERDEITRSDGPRT
ncbi:MAG: N-acetylmuramoyl-L-alanine amidase [Chthoniobacterales bacterium]